LRRVAWVDSAMASSAPSVPSLHSDGLLHFASHALRGPAEVGSNGSSEAPRRASAAPQAVVVRASASADGDARH